MAQSIPLSSVGARRIAINLGQEVGVFELATRFNSTTSRWYLDLFDVDGTPLAVGLGLVPSQNIIRHLTGLTNRVGQFRVIDIDGLDNSDADRLGVGVGTLHYDPNEFENRYPGYDTPTPKPLSFDIDDLFVDDQDDLLLLNT